MTIRIWIADMETDGVRFTDEQIQILNKERELLLCNYSGLPSPSAYADEEEFYHGHS